VNIRVNSWQKNMSDIAIRVENLSKQYRIGGPQAPYKTIRESLTEAVRAPFRRLASVVRGQSSAVTNETIWALKDVSFEVKRGEVVGIIGRNGAGKSTLLKILTRITEPTEGRAEMHGRVGSLLEVGTGFHYELTGRENIYLNGAILGMKRAEIERKFDEIVDFSGVEKFIDTPVKHYSSGMHVRLAFSVAAHLEPEILLVDEVLSVGDYEFQKKCLGKMGEVSREGRTVLLVSHNMTSINNLCGRSLLLEHGKVAMNGNTPDVIQKYLASVHDRSGQIVWDDPHTAPGNDRRRLHSVQTLSAEGKVCSDFDIRQDILIHVAYWNLMDGSKCFIAIRLKDEFGNVVLTSVNIPRENLTIDTWFDRPHPVGLFETVCRIPGNLLNSKTYSVGVMSAGRAKSDLDFHVPDAISFKVSDLGTRNIYNINLPGSVRPKLAWSTEYLGQPAATGGIPNSTPQ